MNKVILSNGKEMPQMLFGSFQLDTQQALGEIVAASAENGAFGFDTSPSYNTEQPLSKAINDYVKKNSGVSREDFFITSKIDEWQMIQKKGDIRPFVAATLKKINQPYIDLLLIHWPQPEYFAATWKSFESVYESGMAKSIGICNARLRHIKTLENSGANICPMVVQNELHPFLVDEQLVSELQAKGIVVQAYSPLFRMEPMLSQNETLLRLAEKYNCSVAQVVLKWHLERKIVPIVKTSKPQRVKENLAAFNIPLEAEDVRLISSLDMNFKLFLESRCCPGY